MVGGRSESILISILYLIGRLPWPTFKTSNNSRGRPYVYSPTVILRCFIVRLWFRLDSNNALHEFLEMDYPYNKKIMKACGLAQVPRSGIDTDARWGFSHTKGWIFGYKLHLISSTWVYYSTISSRFYNC
jgi:hypothetical protein